MKLGEVISKYRTEHQMSMDKFSELSGISKAYISMLEKNRTQRGDEPSPSIDTYRNVAKAIGMDVDELIRMVDGKIVVNGTHAVVPFQPYNPTRKIPILGRISAGLPLYAEEHIEGFTYTELNGGAEYFALRVTGDSMNAARIYDGDTLIVRQQDIVENGQIAVVIVGDDEATVKRFYKDGKQITLMPQSTNHIHQPQIYDSSQTHIRVVGLVVKNEITF